MKIIFVWVAALTLIILSSHQLSAQVFYLKKKADQADVKEILSSQLELVNLILPEGKQRATASYQTINDSTSEGILTIPGLFPLNTGKLIDAVMHLVAVNNKLKYTYTVYNSTNIAEITNSEEFSSWKLHPVGEIYCDSYYNYYSRLYKNSAGKVVMEYHPMEVAKLPISLQQRVKDSVTVLLKQLAEEEEMQLKAGLQNSVHVAKDFHDGLAAIGIAGAGTDKDGKSVTLYAYIDTAGILVEEEPYYLMASDFQEHYALVIDPDTKLWEFIPDENRGSIEGTFQHAYLFNQGRALVYRNTGFGFIDTLGTEITKLKYFDARSFSEGMAAVKNENKWGFIDLNGKEALILQFDKVHDFKGGYALVGKEGDNRFKSYYIRKDGQVAYEFSSNERAIPATLDELRNNSLLPGDFYNDMAIIERDGKQIYINITGKEVIRVKSRGCKLKLRHFVNGYARIEACGKWGMIDRNGNWVIAAEYDAIGDMFNDRVAVMRNGNWGFADKTGQIIINPGITDRPGAIQKQASYDYVSNFSEGLAVVRVNENYGYIDTNGQWFIKPTLKNARPFKNGFACVIFPEGEKEWQYIRRDGTQIPIYLPDPSIEF
ncbi:WG repeat-containing protein [Chitinophaga silvatica]|uniref:WG repeat-containing protein n=1 Tax=Chitinophaga silvatica TaxID=2282649 RepID=A0A3E1Y435_9BACT|nr:WG repeat-containing protein [Chitinophaga silvatica]RFS19444.1 WG repeat-containing protein [Chitinophaga silvatica]